MADNWSDKRLDLLQKKALDDANTARKESMKRKALASWRPFSSKMKPQKVALHFMAAAGVGVGKAAIKTAEYSNEVIKNIITSSMYASVTLALITASLPANTQQDLFQKLNQAFMVSSEQAPKSSLRPVARP
jgi:hypothetical protein